MTSSNGQPEYSAEDYARIASQKADADKYFDEWADRFNSRFTAAPTAPEQLDDPTAWVFERIAEVRDACVAANIVFDEIILDVHPDAAHLFTEVPHDVEVCTGRAAARDIVTSVDTFSITVEPELPALAARLNKVLGFAPIGLTGSDLLQGIETRYVLQREGMAGDDAREAAKRL